MPRQPKGEEYARLLLTTIREIREEYHACTSREIGRRLQVPHQIINRQFDVLKAVGLVDASRSMPGSVHLTAKGGKVASGAPMPPLPPTKKTVYKVRASQDVNEGVPAPADWPPPPAPAA